MTQYNQEWYDSFSNSTESAKHIAKMVYDIVQPESVVDVGCGIGAWLVAYQKLGVTDFIGIDGDYVDPTWLQIPKEQFIAHDLQKPFRYNKQFDLAVCLEVGEHLQTKSSETLVQTLVNLAPVIQFSAAVPFQGGTAHVNEQWQSFWAKLFHSHGYVPVDYVRKRIWANDDIFYYYRQNIVIYVEKSIIAHFPELQAEALQGDDLRVLDVVHPSMLDRIHVRRALQLTTRAGKNALSRRKKDNK